MTQAKLFILKQEIELLWVDMNYQRETRRNGKVATEIMGGLITLCFATDRDTDLILRWMTKESEDNTRQEVDKMEKGKVCFYENGFDYPATKTYEFNDAHLIYFKETFNAEGEDPMQTIITISPAIQNYGTDFVKHWNVNFISPEEQQQNTFTENVENNSKEIIDYFITNTNNEKIDDYKEKEIIFLNIKTKNRIGDYITLDLEDADYDFEYKGKVLPNDILKDIKINNNLTKVKLKVIEPKK